jgi:hypothetical protein
LLIAALDLSIRIIYEMISGELMLIRFRFQKILHPNQKAESGRVADPDEPGRWPEDRKS